MRKTDKNKYFFNIGYLIIFSLFLIGVYYLTIFCCRTFFVHAGKGLNSGWVPEQNNLSAGTFCPSAEVISSDKPQIFNSFFDSFASDYLINSAASTLYRDDLAAAVYFRPLYTWDAAPMTVSSKNKEELDKIILSDFLDPLAISDQRCLGGDCLTQKGKRLSYQGKSVSLPKEVKESDIAALTIGALKTRWLIGVTLKEGTNYEGRVYIFDGSEFTPFVFADRSEKISSPYLGQFGFGGIESDYLIIYGAYRGQAYRFQSGEVSDLSTFFDFRIMATGFRPEIIRAANGVVVNWYIYSSSLGRPRLIKLWQNDGGKISGEADYQAIFTNTGESAVFGLLEAKVDEFILVAGLKQDGIEALKIFTDRGFDNKMPGGLIFNPIVVDSELTIKKLADSQLGSPDNPCSEGTLSFSEDNNFWQALPSGQNLNQNFNAVVSDNYFLRVDFPAQKESFYSPFLNEVLFDFYYQK